MEKIEIIKFPDEKKPYFIINKPKGLASAPIKNSNKPNALGYMIEKYPYLSDVEGKNPIEHGLLHRLDTETDGLMIIASTNECYENLIKLQKNNKIQKFYKANCNFSKNNADILKGFPPVPDYNYTKDKEYTVKSFFRNYGQGSKEVRPVLNNSGKAAISKIGKPTEYITSICIKEIYKNDVTVECKITNGFRHQVRNHLAWIGLPVKGDTLYNCDCKEKEDCILEFSAVKLVFEYPEGDLNSYVL